MNKIIGLEMNRNFKEDSDIIRFNDCVEELLKFDEVVKLHDFSQHFNTSRLQHSVNVSYYSFRVCKKLGWDYRSAARAGLLHDLFLYDWRVEKQPEGHHAMAHPIVALRNANKLTQLNEIEQDAIVNHMWPVTLTLPKYKESMIVSLADKYSACEEIVDQVFDSVRKRLSFPKSLLFGGVYAR